MRRKHGDGQPILRRILLLLVIPLASLIGLWGFTTAASFQEVAESQEHKSVNDRLSVPLGTVIALLQQERNAAAAYLGMPGAESRQRFQGIGGMTDEAIAAFVKVVEPEAAKSDVVELKELAEFGRELSSVGGLRTRALSARAQPLPVIEGYNTVVDGLFQSMSELPGPGKDEAAYWQIQGVIYWSWSRELVQRENALVTSSAASKAKKMTAAHRATFAQWAGRRAQLLELGRKQLRGQNRQLFDQFVGSQEFVRYTRLENAIIQHGIGGAGPDQSEWQAAVVPVAFPENDATRQISARATQEIDAAGDRLVTRLYLFGGLGLLAVVLSIVLLVRFARRTSQDLYGLQTAAQSLAKERLPRVVARLRRGEKVDVAAEAPELPGSPTREIALLAEAFTDVQRTAVRVAVAEADLRGSINQVFINLSWRSLALLQRQLKLLDAMERRASSPEELDDLFKVDHLTTRMRRHAEGLVILSGAPTVRAWERPVPVEDIVRAALSEVEEYQRVDTMGAAPVSLSSEVVADVIHLLAELIENATVFSPPDSEVTVKLDVVANGVVVEIVDRGIGVLPDEMEGINRRLSTAPDFDLADSDRLGLFVVATLASRHGLSVRLQPSPYGGATAVVLVPADLIVVDVPEAVEPPGSRPRNLELPPAPPSRPAGYGAPAQGWTPPPAPSSFEEPERFEPEAPPAPPLAAPSGGRLPKRTKRQSLAPQLRRNEKPRHARQDEGDDDGFVEPDPEASQNLMSMLQSGWARSRNEHHDPRNPDNGGKP